MRTILTLSVNRSELHFENVGTAWIIARNVRSIDRCNRHTLRECRYDDWQSGIKMPRHSPAHHRYVWDTHSLARANKAELRLDILSREVARCKLIPAECGTPPSRGYSMRGYNFHAVRLQVLLCTFLSKAMCCSMINVVHTLSILPAEVLYNLFVAV